MLSITFNYMFVLAEDPMWPAFVSYVVSEAENRDVCERLFDSCRSHHGNASSQTLAAVNQANT